MFFQINSYVAHLINAGVPFAEREVLLLRDFLPEKGTLQEEAEFKKLIDRRAKGEPVSRITGSITFCNLSFTLSPQTFRPCRDTEHLVFHALDFLEESKKQDLRILDMGTGSGCIILSLLHLFPYATGVGIDISADAIDCARQNSEQLNLSEKVDFRVQSWEEPFSEQFDLVVTNPPTIPTSALSCLPPEMGKYNPRISLDGGEDGMDFFRKMDFVLAPLLKNTGKGIFQAFSVEREASFFSQKTYKTRPLFSYRGDPCALSVSLI